FSCSSRSASACSYSQWRAIVFSQSSRRSSTRRELRYSSGARSNASSSAVVPRSRATSSYKARAWPISFCAMDENATSSSSSGAMPVHPESRPPRIRPSPAISSNERASDSCTCLLELLLQGVAVDAVVVAVELVDKVLDLDDRLARHHPQCGRLTAAAVLLARIDVRERVVRRLDRSGVLERLPLPLLPEDLVDHAACASTMLRTHAEFSRARRRRSSRSCDFAAWPVTTLRSSSQSGSVYAHTPSSFLRRFGSGTVRPSSQIWGT